MDENEKSKVVQIGMNDELSLIEQNYEGISKMLDSFTRLYETCENKKLIESLIERLTTQSVLFKS